MAQASPRPKGVTAVVVLIIVTAVFEIVSAVLQILVRDDTTIALWSGAITLVIAVVYLLLAKGIADGRNVARVIVAVASSLMVVAAVWIMFTQPHLWLSLIVQVILGMLVLGMLYTDRATEFFTRKAE